MKKVAPLVSLPSPVIDINPVRESNPFRNEWKRLEEKFSKNFKSCRQKPSDLFLCPLVFVRSCLSFCISLLLTLSLFHLFNERTTVFKPFHSNCKACRHPWTFLSTAPPFAMVHASFPPPTIFPVPTISIGEFLVLTILFEHAIPLLVFGKNVPPPLHHCSGPPCLQRRCIRPNR